MTGRKILCLILGIFILSTTACKASPKVESTENALGSLARENIQHSVLNTPFSAVVRYINEQRIPGNYEDFIVYTLEVEDVIRGSDFKTLTYEMVVEKGESSELTKEAVIISLCHDEEGFYWPGTGSQFPLTGDLLDAAKKVARQADNKQTVFAYCE